MKALDDRGNVGFSNTASFVTDDNEPPMATRNLHAIRGENPGAIALEWTAPGDDGADGLAVAYDFRFSTSGAF